MGVGEDTENLDLGKNMTLEACEEYTYLGVKTTNNGSCQR